MRLIDADEEAKWVYEHILDAKERHSILNFLRDCSTVDAIQVVRCKECDKRGTIFCPMVHETLGSGLVDYASDDGYCNWAPRKK